MISIYHLITTCIIYFFNYFSRITQVMFNFHTDALIVLVYRIRHVVRYQLIDSIFLNYY